MVFVRLPSIRVDLTGLHHFSNTMRRDLRFKRNGPVRLAIRDWVKIYEKFIDKRFLRLSSSGGGGVWPDITERTKLRKGSDLILIETGEMRKAIQPRFGKRNFKHKKFGVTVTYGNKEPVHRSKLLQAQLISLHHKKRPIIVAPDDRTKREMRKRMVRGLKEARNAAARIHRRANRR